MKKIVQLQIKNELIKIKNNGKIKLEKREEKEIHLKRKKSNKKEIGARKVYYMIWKQILKNIKKDFFRILIHIKCNENGDVFVWKIVIDKHIKKIIRIPADIHLLINLLSTDGFYVHVSRDSKAVGSDNILAIEVPRHLLEHVIFKSAENSSAKTKKMKVS